MKILSDAELQEAYNKASPEQRREFERRHRNCLILAICIKSAIIGGLIWLNMAG